jgi:hypothetical protein
MGIEAFSRYICSYITEKEESLPCGAPLSLTHIMMVDTYFMLYPEELSSTHYKTSGW